MGLLLDSQHDVWIRMEKELAGRYATIYGRPDATTRTSALQPTGMRSVIVGKTALWQCLLPAVFTRHSRGLLTLSELRLRPQEARKSVKLAATPILELEASHMKSMLGRA